MNILSKSFRDMSNPELLIALGIYAVMAVVVFLAGVTGAEFVIGG
jgi:hypothetical protein